MKRMSIKRKFILICAMALLPVLIASQFVSCGIYEQEQDMTNNLAQTSSDGSEDELCNLLLVGRDNSAGLADVLMLVSFNMTRSSASLLQIPRDTYAEYTDKSYKKLNGALSELGAKELCSFISESLCVPVDYYAIIDLEAFGEAVDMIGGVEVDIPFDLDYEDPEQGLYIHLDSGRQLLDGESAQHFVRYRSGYSEGDVGRIDAQKIFLSAFIRRVKEKATVLTIGSMAIKIFDDVRTNISITKLISLAKTAISLNDSDIRFITLPGASAVAKKSGASYYVISRVATMRLINEYFGGFADEEAFDRERKFLNEGYDEFGEIYRSDAEYSVYDVSSIENGAIDINRN